MKRASARHLKAVVPLHLAVERVKGIWSRRLHQPWPKPNSSPHHLRSIAL